MTGEENPETVDARLVNGALDRESAVAVFRALEQQARELGVSLRPPPREPMTCCGRGCNGCVWEGYYAAATFWREDALLAISASS